MQGNADLPEGVVTSEVEETTGVVRVVDVVDMTAEVEIEVVVVVLLAPEN